ncbi:hypothetical protein CHELA1G11_12357 [Hyphomicrobiales bacterium]|nr:hypothetical protein CHELA1G2_11953 [Hyphomicrobiales bacterium]CAH1664279.1 hypothetical protein CHELA1G11_12357 [Hyphomicrobiales bacterium]
MDFCREGGDDKGRPIWCGAHQGSRQCRRFSWNLPQPSERDLRPSSALVRENASRTRFVKHSRLCKTEAEKALFYNPLVGDSLTVELRTLTPLVLVRIQVPQPIVFIRFFAFSQLDRKRHFTGILQSLFTFRPPSTTPRAS